MARLSLIHIFLPLDTTADSFLTSTFQILLALVIVVGTTNSSDFPTTEGAYDRTHNGADDIFVAKLSPDGRSLIYATYLGSNYQDSGIAIAVDDRQLCAPLWRKVVPRAVEMRAGLDVSAGARHT